MRTQPDWMRKVRPGSILRKGKSLRVVREASRYPNGDLHCVTFVIKHCSWTRRPYTVVCYNDLRWMGYELVEGVTVKVDTEFDEKLKADMHKSRKHGDVFNYDCCDVKGFP